MNTIFRYTLSRSRGGILGWGIGMFLLGLMIVPVYSSFEGQGEMMEQLLDAFPPEMMAFFGEMSSLDTIEGFLEIEYFAILPLILGIYAITSGGGMIANDEENGTLDLVAAHPISRSSLFFGRFLSILTGILAILVLSWLGLVVPAQAMENVSLAGIGTPFLSLFSYILLFTTLALALSLLLPSKRITSMVVGIFMVADFFIQGFARLNTDLEAIADVLPLKFYQGTGWVTDRLNTSWFFGEIAVAVLLLLFAWWRFARRDIRVGGEGTWEFPLISKLRRGKVEVSGD
ncbi:MAG: ABC transporter permease subunit [Chloroflexi bacterium]|nr:ABC transporter permease subunit [Chloroflexota bacterium]